jgi:thiamine transport system ATP-binding protein/spermidine/putrescine transport system ATP-binding protein
MPVLTVKELHKDYDAAPLLNGVSFEVRGGEILCLLGRSGSGKSTLLRIIAGLETAESGDVLWNGVSMLGIPTHQRNFGLMFQDYALFPHKNVTENVAFGLEMQHLPAAELKKQVHESLERVNMTVFANRSVAELSGGEQQRVALARALAAKPRLLMLDEPLAALDRSMRLELQEELHTLLQQPELPVIYVTHDQEEAVILGDRLAILHDGQIEQTGTAQELYNAPNSCWVAEFLGMTNFIPGEIVSLNPFKIHTAAGDFTPPALANALPPIGSHATVMIKTHGVSVTPSEGNINTISGIVRSSVYREDGYRIHIDCGLTQDLEFLLHKPYEPGSTLHLEIPPPSLVYLAK